MLQGLRVLSSTFIIFLYSIFFTYYTNLSSSTIPSLFWWCVIWFCISVDFSSVCEAVSGKLYDTVLGILIEILLPIISPFACAVLRVTLFGIVLWGSLAECLTWLRGFWLYSPFKCFYWCFYLYLNLYWCFYLYLSSFKNIWSLDLVQV